MLKLGRAEIAVWFVWNGGTAAAVGPAAMWKWLPPCPLSKVHQARVQNNGLLKVALQTPLYRHGFPEDKTCSSRLSGAGLCNAPPPHSLKSTVFYFQSAAEIDPIFVNIPPSLI